MTAEVAAYARVSTTHQAERQTIDQQLQALQAYALEQGLLLGPEHIYRDDGHSGARLDRPGLDRLRDAVARGEVERVLITSPDRLARRYAYQVWLLEELERAGCSVIFLERPPSDDPQDTLLIQIRGAVAEYERTVIADRLRRGRLAALQAGRLLPWTIPPFGYRLDPQRPRDPGGVRVEEAEAEVVRQIFRWYVEEGISLYSVAQRLSDRRIPTATGKTIWTPGTVRAILTNHSYQGTAYGNREQRVPARKRYPLVGREPKGEGGLSRQQRAPKEWIGVPVPAIVLPEQFVEAQERLARNQQWALRNTHGQYLLRRLVSCRRCGLAHWVSNNGRHAYYQCGGKQALVLRYRHERCEAPKVVTEQLDEVVWGDVCQLLGDPSVLEDALRWARQGWLGSEDRAARRQGARRRQAEVERQIQRLVDAYVASVLTLDELQRRRVKLDQRLSELRRESRQLAGEEVRGEHMEAIATRAEEFRAAIARGLDQASFEERRQLVELLIDRVVVDAPEVEIRYVIPLSGIAERKGVLRSRHLRGNDGL